jgi:hypothetical protein
MVLVMLLLQILSSQARDDMIELESNCVSKSHAFPLPMIALDAKVAHTQEEE